MILILLSFDYGHNNILLRDRKKNLLITIIYHDFLSIFHIPKFRKYITIEIQYTYYFYTKNINVN